MRYTLRSAFIKWVKLHDEESKYRSSINPPSWFGFEVRRKCSWKYFSSHDNTEQTQRHTHGYYDIYLDDEILLNIHRPVYPKEHSQLEQKKCYCPECLCSNLHKEEDSKEIKYKCCFCSCQFYIKKQ